MDIEITGGEVYFNSSVHTQHTHKNIRLREVSVSDLNSTQSCRNVKGVAEPSPGV